MIKIFIGVLVLGLSFQLEANSQVKKSNKKLSTQIDFEDRTVGGKYQYSTEALARVEDDKGLDDLIGVRKHFKDRVESSKELK